MKKQSSALDRKFTGHRIQVDTRLSFEEVRGRLQDSLGHATMSDIQAVAQAVKSAEEYVHEIEGRFVGKSGFMLFYEIDHGGWIGAFGIRRKALRLILGNPLIAITMLRHDLNAGLFVPVELLLTDKSDGGSRVVYVRPSSLIAVDDNQDLSSAAKSLDEKFEALITHATDA